MIFPVGKDYLFEDDQVDLYSVPLRGNRIGQVKMKYSVRNLFRNMTRRFNCKFFFDIAVPNCQSDGDWLTDSLLRCPTVATGFLQVVINKGLTIPRVECRPRFMWVHSLICIDTDTNKSLRRCLRCLSRNVA